MRNAILVCVAILLASAFIAVPRLVTGSLRSAGNTVAEGTHAVASSVEGALDAQAKAQGDAMADAMKPELEKLAAVVAQPQQPITLVLRVERDGDVAVVPNK